MNFYFFAANPATTAPVTGLALADFEVDVIRTNKATHITAIVVAAAWMTAEVGGGFYVYTVPEPDLYVYDYAVSVRYTGVTPVDTSLWAGVDASTGAPVSTAAASLLSVDALASLAEVPVTGLTLADFTVNVYRLPKDSALSTQVVTGAAMSVEVGSGHYGYYLAGCNFVAYDYLVTVNYIGVDVLDCVLWIDKPIGDILTTPTVERIEIALRYLLVAADTLASDRVYPLALPPQVTLPAIAYARISTPRIYCLTGFSHLARPRFQISAWAETYAAAVSLAAEIRLVLDAYHGTILGVEIQCITIANEMDRLEPKPERYGVMTDYIVSHTE